MNKYRRFLAVSVMMVAGTLLSAQKARMYDSVSGLTNTSINRVSQDSEGFLWIATQGGLFRFDGTNFVQYGSEFQGGRSDVLVYHEDERENAWVGTSQGLYLRRSGSDVFVPYELSHLESSTSTPYVSDIVEDLSGHLFVATSGSGVYAISTGTCEHDDAMTEKISAAGAGLYVNRLFLDSTGRLWICSQLGGVYPISSKTGRLLNNIRMDTLLPPPDSGFTVNDIAEDRDSGNIYFASPAGIFVLDTSTLSIRKARDCNLSVTSIYIDSDEKGKKFCLVGTENNGVMVFNLHQEKAFREIFPNVPFDMDHLKIHCMMKDNQGNIWIGAFQTGLVVFPRPIYGFASYEFFPASVTSFAGSGSDLWVGTDGAGVYHMVKGGRSEVLNADNSSLSNNSVITMAMDNGGRLWIGTYLDGLFIKSPSGVISRFKDSSGLPSEKISVMLYDKAGDRMYVGMFGGGVAIVSASDQKILKLIDDRQVRWPEALMLDGNQLWVGSVTGLHRYNLLLDELEANLVPNTTVLSSILHDGKIVLGTRDGIIFYDPSTGRSTNCRKADGLADDVVTGLAEGFDGDLWASTSNGLSLITKDKIKNFYSYDGLPGNEFRRSAVLRTKDFIYLGGNKGMTMISAGSQAKMNSVLPKLKISGLRVMYETKDSLLRSGGPLKIRHRENLFSIGYTALEFTNPNRVRYSYMMEGFDKDWINDGGNHRAYYSNLPSGKYTFSVRANYEGENEYSDVSIELWVLPPWYLTWWAIIIYLLLGVAAVYSWIYIRNRHENNTLNRMRLNMFTDLTHEIRTPLNLVMSPLKAMREGETDAKMKDKYNLMYRNCLRINRIVNQLMDVRKIDEGKVKLNFRPTDIIPFIKDIMKSFQSLEESLKLRFTLESPLKENVLWVDQGNFDKILFNLLSNAFKHTPEEGEIKITVSPPVPNSGILSTNVSQYVKIDVFNSGSSIDARDLDKVFDRFFQSSSADATTGSGVGLNLAKMLTQMHHGRIWAGNVDGGVCFTLYMPCGKAHLSRQELDETTHHKDLYTTEHRDISDLEKTQVSAAGNARNKKNIAIVDDDIEFLAYIQKELAPHFNVMAYSDASKALSAIEALKPDAVVSDLIMTGMNGDELCRRVRKTPEISLIPVIILTAQSEDEVLVQMSSDSGADRILSKPISIDYLKSNIIQAISLRDKINARGDNSIVFDFAGIKMSSASDRLVARVMDIIKNNLSNPDLSVETICSEVGISRVHLNRKLKDLVGISPSALIRETRLRQAAYLLVHNEVNVSEVAFRVGYSSLSHFSNSFREYYGMAPKEFVSKYQGTDDVSYLKQFEPMDK